MQLLAEGRGNPARGPGSVSNPISVPGELTRRASKHLARSSTSVLTNCMKISELAATLQDTPARLHLGASLITKVLEPPRRFPAGLIALPGLCQLTGCACGCGPDTRCSALPSVEHHAEPRSPHSACRAPKAATVAVSCAGPAGRAIALGTRPARRHWPLFRGEAALGTDQQGDGRLITNPDQRHVVAICHNAASAAPGPR